MTSKKNIKDLAGNEKWSCVCERIRYWVELCAKVNKNSEIEVCLYTTSDYNYTSRTHTVYPEHNEDKWDFIKNVGTKSFGSNNYSYVYCFVKG